jgi:hypothetical protein
MILARASCGETSLSESIQLIHEFERDKQIDERPQVVNVGRFGLRGLPQQRQGFIAPAVGLQQPGQLFPIGRGFTHVLPQQGPAHQPLARPRRTP